MYVKYVLFIIIIDEDIMIFIKIKKWKIEKFIFLSCIKDDI